MNPTTTNNPALAKLDPTRRRAELLICALALQFECISANRRNASYFRPGYFDAVKLEKDSRVWSTGEQHCVNFILAVWSGNDWEADAEEGRPYDRSFELINAMGTLGIANVEPIINWMKKPFWP